MILLQTITNSISSIPYGIQFLYAAITLNVAKNEYRLAQERLLVQITRLSYFINFISAFYIYYFSSEQIRSTIHHHVSESTGRETKENLFLLTPSKSQLSAEKNRLPEQSG